MSGHLTFAMIKPHIIRERKVGKIVSRIEEAGFAILVVKNVQLSFDGARQFYQEHEGKPFFDNLVSVMSSGPLWAMSLGKPNAVEEWRELIGATDSAKAAPGTIRFEFGHHDNISLNAVHGSDSDHSAFREIGFFFGVELALAARADEAKKEPIIKIR